MERLEELLSAYLEDSATPAQVAELAGMLRGNPEGQRLAARLFVQHGTLAWILRGAGASIPSRREHPRLRAWWIGIPVAASLMLTFFMVRHSPGGPVDRGPQTLRFQDGTAGYSGTRDTRLSDKDRTVSRGTDGFIEVESSTEPGGKPTLIRWDLREIPAGSRVLSASITLHIASLSRDEVYAVHALRRPWVEDEATWMEYAAGKSWAVPGGKGSEDYDAAVLARFRPTKGSFTFELGNEGVARLQSWIDSPGSNQGFILVCTASQGEFYAHSREADAAATRPALSITFRPPAR